MKTRQLSMGEKQDEKRIEASTTIWNIKPNYPITSQPRKITAVGDNIVEGYEQAPQGRDEGVTVHHS